MLWTNEHAANLKQYLESHTLPRGLGTKESACSIAAINLAIDGRLTDNTPDCMSEVLGKAIINLQDQMPDDMRNSDRYRAMLMTAPGTGREKEEKRLAVLMDWMWGTVLPQLQTDADKKGFGDEWRIMCEQRTYESASDASFAARCYGASLAAAAARAASFAARADYDTACAAYDAAYAAVCAAHRDFWQKVDPIGVLERMIEV